MIIFGIFVVMLVIGIVVLRRTWCYDSDFLDFIGVSGSILGLIGSCISAFCMMSYHGYFREAAYKEYCIKYDTICSMTDDGCRYNTVEELANLVIEYNSDVVKGRMKQENLLLKDYTYDFWDELELIDVGKIWQKSEKSG